jgi:acylphosphatase
LISNKSCDKSEAADPEGRASGEGGEICEERSGGIDMERARARVIIEGRVQGVFFRHHTQEMALCLGVTGWVKNRRDGSVEAVFEGDQERVDQILRWCHRGPSEARVTRVHSTWEKYTGEFEDFSVTY